MEHGQRGGTFQSPLLAIQTAEGPFSMPGIETNCVEVHNLQRNETLNHGAEKCVCGRVQICGGEVETGRCTFHTCPSS